MVKQLQKMGLSSNAMYAMGFASIGLSVAAWAASLQIESAGMERADRWGIFVGQWAPTFFALGCAMRMEEQWGGRGRHEESAYEAGEIREPMHVG